MSSNKTSNTFAVHNILRSCIGIILLAVSAVAILSVHNVGWGVAWTIYIPAFLLLIPASACLQRRLIEFGEHSIIITTGRLYKRGLELNLNELSVEDIPLAGFRALLLHQDKREFPLATWLTSKSRDRLLSWLDEQHQEAKFPRHDRERARAEWDK